MHALPFAKISDQVHNRGDRRRKRHAGRFRRSNCGRDGAVAGKTRTIKSSFNGNGRIDERGRKPILRDGRGGQVPPNCGKDFGRASRSSRGGGSVGERKNQNKKTRRNEGARRWVFRPGREWTGKTNKPHG